MLPSSRTFLLFQVISLIDSGKHKVSFEQMHDAAERRRVDAFLNQLADADLDLSIFSGEDWSTLHDEWESMANAIDARRKFGIENDGLCLLAGYLIQGIQQNR